MVRFNDKTQIDTGSISSDDIIPITDISDASDDKKITLGQIKTFTLDDTSVVKTIGTQNIGGAKTFTDGVQFSKGNISLGQYATLPTGLGAYVASYVSPTYGARILSYDGAAYQDLSLGSMPVAGTISMKSLANGDCNFGYNVNITGDVTANKFIGDGSELTNIAGALKTEALGIITSGTTLKDGYVSTAHVNGTFAIALPTTLATGIENVSIFDFTTTSTSQPTITSSRNLTGTCAVTNGSSTVTGTSTLFLTELEVGSKITIATVDYQVLSIASDASLELTAVYADTTASGLTVGHKFVKWSDKNGGKAPTAYSIVSGVRNVLVFKTHDGGTTWEAEYGTFGGVETTFVQPALSANGTLGGAAFAVQASSESSGYPAYQAADNVPSTEFSWGVAGAGSYIWYNPQPLKVPRITILNASAWALRDYVIYGSNNNSTYTQLTSGTFSATTGGTTVIAEIPEVNRNFYNYYKMYISTYLGSGNGRFAQGTLTDAVYIST